MSASSPGRTLRRLATKAMSVFAQGLHLTDQRLYSFLGGGETDAGERVSVEMAMQLDVVWACVRRIAETIATLPLNFYSANPDGIGTLDTEHPLYFILHHSPNYDMTAVNFWECMVGCYLLWGNSFAEIVRGGDGRITSLNPMRPDRVQVRRDANGDLIYIYNYLGQSFTFTAEQVFHIRGFSLDGLMGMSPVQQARQTLGTARATQRARASIFRNGMRPSGVLIAPKYLNAAQREETKPLIEKFSGAGNTGSVPLLEGGWDFKSLAISPEDAQFIQTETFQVEQICRWFDVPPVLVGHSAQTTWGSGIEQIMLGWLTFGLRAHLKRIEQAIGSGLLTPQERGRGYYAEYDVDGLLRGDSASRADMMVKLVNNGLRTRDEMRGKDNLGKLPGGDILTVAANLLPATDIGKVAKLPKDRKVAIGASVDAPPEEPTKGTAS
jgi:HK97 family phage portal protein